MGELASRQQLNMSLLRWTVVTVPAILLLGIGSGRLANSGYDNLWFAALVKPDIMPPGWVFGAAWSLLYVLLGLALAIVLNARGARLRGLAISLFIVQLMLNLCWSPLFFAAHQVWMALALIVAILLTATVTTALFGRIRKTAAWLMLPYLAWLCFATVLNYQVGWLNPNAHALVPGRATTQIAP